jgi:hypothetical protein
MKYMALIYSDPALEPPYGTPEFGAMMAGYGTVNDAMRAAGVYLHADGLQDIHTATSVRLRGGKTETMDGPFAETKERLGGYYVMECKDLDEALHYAAMIPSAAYGTVEVRPIAAYNL